MQIINKLIILHYKFGDIKKREYAKSEELYHDSLSLNARSADAAIEEEKLALNEERKKYQYENEESILENLLATGGLAAKGVQGRGAAKTAQVQMAELGRNQAIMKDSLLSAELNTKANLKNIQIQLDQANTLAKSKRMLRPSAAPKPIKPLKQVLTDYEYPRELEDYDFGPKPIRGQSTVQVPSWGSVFANALTSGMNMASSQW